MATVNPRQLMQPFRAPAAGGLPTQAPQPVLKQPLPAPLPAGAPPPQSFLTRVTTPTQRPNPVVAQSNQAAGYDQNAWNSLSAADKAKYTAGGGAPGQPAPEFAPQQQPAAQPKPNAFGPGNSLIGQQIAAPASGANSYDQQAAQYAQGAGMQGYTGQTDQARQMVLDQLKTLQSAPDRFALAQSNYDQFQKDADPAYQQQLRGVGQKAAAFGRIGAGMTTNDLTGALGQHQNLLSGERTRGINQALENTMADRLNVSGQIQSGSGLLGGQDLSMGQARSNAALGQAAQFGGLGQSQYGREANAAQMQQQQQQYQSGLDQQNIQNGIAQQQLTMGGQQQAWQQQFAQQQLALQAAAQQNTQYPTGGYGGGISSGQLGYQGY